MMINEKTKRRNSLQHFGFGADVMKSVTVCVNCNSMESSNRIFCSVCSTRLPRTNLYDYYKAQHRCCGHCGTVLTDYMNYCPKCGTKLQSPDRKSNTRRNVYGYD